MTAEDIANFRNAALALAGAERTVMREVGKGMRAAAKPIVNEIRTKVRSSKGESPKGTSSASVERQLYVLSKVKSKGAGSIYDEATGLRIERRARAVQRRVARAASLRDQIAKASGASVSASDKSVALAFKVRAGNLPPSQRKLPRRWDLPNGWRHPVFGNRDVWVQQIGHPYFRTTVTAGRDQVTAGVITAMTVAAEKIMHPEGEIS